MLYYSITVKLLYSNLYLDRFLIVWSILNISNLHPVVWWCSDTHGGKHISQLFLMSEGLFVLTGINFPAVCHSSSSFFICRRLSLRGTRQRKKHSSGSWLLKMFTLHTTDGVIRWGRWRWWPCAYSQPEDTQTICKYISWSDLIANSTLAFSVSSDLLYSMCLWFIRKYTKYWTHNFKIRC